MRGDKSDFKNCFATKLIMTLQIFRGKPTLFVPLKEILDVKSASLINGSGQNSETLSRQKKVLEDRKRKTMANAKIFEELERQADEEYSKDLVKHFLVKIIVTITFHWCKRH